MHATFGFKGSWPAHSRAPSVAQMVLEHRTSGKSSTTAASAATRSTAIANFERARRGDMTTDTVQGGACRGEHLPPPKELRISAA